eukprot:jgi/Hompol1/1706/HPOL_005690-RA
MPPSRKEMDVLIEYMDAAIDRIEIGLASAVDPTVSSHLKLHALMGQIKLRKAVLVRFKSEDDSDALLAESEKSFDEARRAESSHTATRNRVLADAAQMCYAFADRDAKTRLVADHWIQYARGIWEEILESDSVHLRAHVGLGTVLLHTGDLIIEQSEINNSEEGLEAAIAPLEQALEHLRKAIEIHDAASESEKAGTSKVAIQCLLGEVCVNLGNLNEDGDDEGMDSEIALAFYTEAVQAFKAVQSVDPQALPAQFAEFVQEWEADMR